MFNEAMQEILLGHIREFDGQIAVFKIMEKVKIAKEMSLTTECFMLKLGIQL